MRGIDGRYMHTHHYFIFFIEESLYSFLLVRFFPDACLIAPPSLSLSLSLPLFFLSFFLSFLVPFTVTAVPRARVGRRRESPSFPREIGGEFSQGWLATDACHPDTDHRAAIVAQSADTQERETDARSPR